MRDLILIPVIILAFAIGFFAVFYITGEVVDQMTANEQINQTEQTVDVLNNMKTLSNRMDYVIFAVFIGLAIALIITTWFIGGHALFMIIYFILAVIMVALSAIFANVWDTFSGASIFGATVASFPLTSHILSNFPIYVAIIAGLGTLTMFAKPYFINEGGQY